MQLSHALENKLRNRQNSGIFQGTIIDYTLRTDFSHAPVSVGFSINKKAYKLVTAYTRDLTINTCVCSLKMLLPV